MQRIKVFLSSTIWQQGGPSFISGRQHYSYGIARRKFEMALRFLDVELHDVPRPEIYAAPVSRAFLDNTSCHLIFKPTEWIRLLKGGLEHCLGHLGIRGADRAPNVRAAPPIHRYPAHADDPA